MIAIACHWGGDLSIGASGDISVVPESVEIQQRLVRRLLTNPGDYVWHTGYGAGLGSYVGEQYASGSIEATILNQIQLEPLIASTPAPSVQTSASQAGPFSAVSVSVQYQISGAKTSDSIVLSLGTN